MPLKSVFSPKPLGYIQMSLFILIELLLIFDKNFSKFHLLGPFYLYDALLILLTSVSAFFLMKKGIRLSFWPVQLIIGVALLYLVYSYLFLHTPINYTIRQFAIFVYLTCIYIIVHVIRSENAIKYNTCFFIIMGLAAFVIQLLYHAYSFAFKNEYLSTLFTGFNYYSEMGFMALFLFESYILIYVPKWWKWLLIIFYLLLMTTLGHQGSTIMITAFIIGLYLILHVSLYKKLILIIAGVICTYAMFSLFPQYFLDNNSLWRYIYWKITLKDIFEHYYGIIGHGFGVKFTTPEVIDEMRTQIESTFFEYKPEEQYLSPMHNSFITIAYHIGFVFMLLIFVPLKNMFAYIFNRRSENFSLEKDFLTLSMLGVIGWSSFHVILELPHSSALFWLIYFTTVFKFNQKESLIVR